jgi:sugar-specific transcriptional regulator TrmB
MYQDILKNIDLSPNESKIYECLIENGELSVNNISVLSKLHRRNAYDAIHRLINKGLCFQIASKGLSLFNAVDPNKIAELFAVKQKEINSIIPLLKNKYKNHRSSEEAYIYRGYEGQKNIWREILNYSQTNYVIGAKGGWFDKRLKLARLDFFKKTRQKKIKFLQLFDQETRDLVPKIVENFPYLKYRFLPKTSSTNSVIHIFGDFVISYTGIGIESTNENVIFFVIKSQDLANSYRTWFWELWKISKVR